MQGMTTSKLSLLHCIQATADKAKFTRLRPIIITIERTGKMVKVTDDGSIIWYFSHMPSVLPCMLGRKFTISIDILLA